MKDATESIKESLSLSDYGLGFERLWERTSGLAGAESRDDFKTTLDDLQKAGVVKFENDRYFLKK